MAGGGAATLGSTMVQLRIMCAAPAPARTGLSVTKKLPSARLRGLHTHAPVGLTLPSAQFHPSFIFKRGIALDASGSMQSGRCNASGSFLLVCREHAIAQAEAAVRAPLQAACHAAGPPHTSK